MNKYFATYMLLALSALANASETVVGNWNFSSSSYEVPQECLSYTWEFTAQGKMIGSDGSYAETRKYTLQKHEQGFMVKTKYLGNNNKENCQGLPASYVQENTINDFFIELSDNEMKLYFSNYPSNSYFVLNRVP